VVSACFVSTLGRAHGDLDLRIAEVSIELKATPTAALYLQRGELRHEHGEFESALADFDRAAKLDPHLEAVNFLRARTLFKAGQVEAARDVLNAYLQSKSSHADAFLLRARVLVRLKEYRAAVGDYDRSFVLAPQPLPEAFLERAEAQVGLGEREQAVTGLDDGIKRLGNLVTLQSAAISIELESKHYDAVLDRVDRVMAALQRKETWLARRGEILDAAGRHTEALQAYRGALAAIEQLPIQHRNLQPMRDLETRLRSLVGA
jgi:tetratricopeptide (TPR) repeat protein